MISATVADNDYVAQSLTGQTIPEGLSNYAFSVLVNGDAADEPDETFFVNVTNVTGADVADGQGLGTITNDDVNFCALALHAYLHYSRERTHNTNSRYSHNAGCCRG